MRARGPAARFAADVVAVVAVVAVVSVSGCASRSREPLVGTSGAPVDTSIAVYTFDSLDERPVSSESMHGRPTVLAFVTTWNWMSQAQIDFLVPMSEHDGDRVHYAMIALQERGDRELVEVYRSKLGVRFPVALGDAETIGGGGALGDVHRVPTVVVLDALGRVTWRHEGLAKSAEIRDALRRADPDHRDRDRDHDRDHD